MFDYETTVAEIELKVRKLIEENDRLRASEESLARQCAELQGQIDNNNLVINNLIFLYIFFLFSFYFINYFYC